MKKRISSRDKNVWLDFFYPNLPGDNTDLDKSLAYNPSLKNEKEQQKNWLKTYIPTFRKRWFWASIAVHTTSQMLYFQTNFSFIFIFSLIVIFENLTLEHEINSFLKK